MSHYYYRIIYRIGKLSFDSTHKKIFFFFLQPLKNSLISGNNFAVFKGRYTFKPFTKSTSLISLDYFLLYFMIFSIFLDSVGNI